MSPDLGNLSGVQQRPPGSVEFIKIILFWLLLRQVQNLGFELEILHVQHLFDLERTDLYRATVRPSLSGHVHSTSTRLFDLLTSVEFSIQIGPLSFSPIVGFSVSPSNKWISHQSWVIFFYFWEWRFFGRERKREIGFTLGQWEERRPAFEKEKIKMFQDREKHEFMTSDYWTFQESRLAL